MMGERLEKTIPQREKAPEKRLRKKAIRGRLEKAIPQKNDGGKGWKRPYPREKRHQKND
jgi:hypothetical protein